LAYFSEVYDLYAHVKMLRLVIETNMRFGSDPTVIYLLDSMPGKDKNVQTMLIDIFGDKENEGLYGTKDEIDDGEDFFPFVYVPMMTIT
jgi:V-type H+-transporting ATPase subunit C